MHETWQSYPNISLPAYDINRAGKCYFTKTESIFNVSCINIWRGMSFLSLSMFDERRIKEINKRWNIQSALHIVPWLPSIYPVVINTSYFSHTSSIHLCPYTNPWPFQTHFKYKQYKAKYNSSVIDQHFTITCVNSSTLNCASTISVLIVKDCKCSPVILKRKINHDDHLTL